MLATLDMRLHTMLQPVRTDDVVADVVAVTSQFAQIPGTHTQASFGHLMGYDAGYYSYQWALAMACDVLTRFKEKGFMDRETADRWRRTVLEQGAGAIDEGLLIEEFLGRKSNTDAYVAYLTGEEA